jgi:hypothetical protein
VTLPDLIAKLQNTPNLLMWMSGHRHINTVKALPAYTDATRTTLIPEKSFWQVETSSLQHFPQQLRTFEIYLNSDDTVSIVTTNVDPAVADGTPAAKSRKNAIAAQQITQLDLLLNVANSQTMSIPTSATTKLVLNLDPMDPTRPTGDPTSATDTTYSDPSIKYGTVDQVPYCASYNAELFKQLSPTMISALKAA